MNEHGLPIEGTLTAAITLYYDLRLPEARPAPLLLALHGYGANKRQMMREAQQIAPEGFAIATLQGPYQHIREPREEGGPLRFGFGWLTNFHPEESQAIHHRALIELIESLAGAGDVDPGQVFLLGFSQSCALNYRFAFSHPDHLRGVIGICGGMPGDWDTNGTYKQTAASIFHLSGERDEFYPPARVSNYAEQLRKRAVDVDFRSYDAAHEMIPAMRDDVRAWLRKKHTA